MGKIKYLLAAAFFFYTCTGTFFAQRVGAERNSRSGASGTSPAESRRAAPVNTVSPGDDELIKKFTPLVPGESVVIIPDIDLGDAALEKLIAEIKQSGPVKNTSLYYKDRLAVVTIISKDKNSTDPWNLLSSGTQNTFSVKKSTARCLLLAYQTDKDNATQQSGTERAGQLQEKNVANDPGQPASADEKKARNEEKNTNNRVSDAKPETRLGEEGTFVHFKQDEKSFEFDEVQVRAFGKISPGYGFAPGLQLEIFDYRKNARIVLFVSNGGKDLTPGRYTFPTRRSGEQANLQTGEAYFIFVERDNRNKLTASAHASTITLSSFDFYYPENITSGYIELTHVQADKSPVRVEGFFKFSTGETKDLQGNKIPAAKITEGKFVVINPGRHISPRAYE